jgi:glycosyltransferase involved in cell wall biosynthesis
MSAPGKPFVLVVMPAYNAAKTLARTWEAIPNDIDQVLLVDDGSSDETMDIARQLPIRTISLPHNIGYGGNQKICYLEALRLNADVVVMLHPDGQYDPILLPELIAPIVDGKADLVLGSRMLTPGGAMEGGMPFYRFVANRVLTMIENVALGTSFSELHTGYRAYSRSFLEKVPFMRNSDDFVFDSQVIAQAVAFGERVVEVPIHTRYHPDASSTSIRASVVYGLATIGVMIRWRLHKARIWACRLFLP